MNKVVTKEIDLNGRKLVLETGKLAQQADASVLASWGETVVLVTVATQPLKESLGYFPLSVEYVEKYYAGGRITSQRFIKREARPSDEAVLSGRAIDRSIRPLFPKDFQNEVQVVVTVLSFDGTNDPVLLGFIGTSAALSISSIPWHGSLGATRLGKRGDSIEMNPTWAEFEHLDLDLMVASTREKIVMIEAGAKEVSDEVMFDAIKQAHQNSQQILDLVEGFSKEAGKEKRAYVPVSESLDPSLLKEVKLEAKKLIEKALFEPGQTWHEATGDQIKEDLATQFAEKVTPHEINMIFDKIAKELMNDSVLKEGKRVDGRGMDEIRPINMQIGVLPRTHGSAMFQRGGTQVLSVATLGPMSAAQTLEGMTGERIKRFMHHYNMSINPFATGEVSRIGAPSRRDIGHGALVEKGLLAVLPSEEEFPYAIRVVSEVLAANASTSMASVCGSTLALLNAGVALKGAVAGIALGLLSSEERFQVITDMQAVEDFYGEMDFKVTGTTSGITAIQMDTKLDGLSFEIIEEALKQGKKARETIIAEINKITPEAAKISEYAPKIEVTHIKPEEIGMLIGPGGKNINKIIATTGASIDIEDDGTVMISSVSEESIKEALKAVEGMFKTVSPGEEYEGKVTRLMPFGAFVEILPGKEGLVHVSQMAPYRVEKPEDIVKEGQDVKVRVVEIDSQGRINLSMLFGQDAEAKPPMQREERRKPFDRFGKEGRGPNSYRDKRRRFGR